MQAELVSNYLALLPTLDQFVTMFPFVEMLKEFQGEPPEMDTGEDSGPENMISRLCTLMLTQQGVGPATNQKVNIQILGKFT